MEFVGASSYRAAMDRFPPGPAGRRVAVHLVRHGETIGYSTDAGLTPKGREQAERRAIELLGEFEPGSDVAIVHSPRARASESAEVIAGVLRRSAGPALSSVRGPELELGFDNFHVWTTHGEEEVTAAFHEFEGARAALVGAPTPGWITEADRFWQLHESGGDPIGHWLSQPLQHFEPAAVVVRRFWCTTVELVGRLQGHDHVVVCTHSGPIRAIATHALGYDPGEPEHLETVRLDLEPGSAAAVLTFRGEVIELDVPTGVQPSWFA